MWKYSKAADWDQDNTILIQPILCNYTKFLVNSAKRVQLAFKTFSKNGKAVVSKGGLSGRMN